MTAKDKEELIQYRLRKAEETINEVEILFKNELWNTAINRMYYACYYAVIALLLKNNIKTTTHAGARQMLALHFIKTGTIDKDLGKFYSNIFDMRQNADYADFIDFTKADVLELIKPAKALILNVQKLIV